MVEARGVGIFSRIENTKVIDFPRRQKRRTRQNCPKLERIWNTGFQISCQFCEVFLKRRKISSPVNRFEPMNSPYGTPGHFTGKCGRSSAEVTRPALLPFSIASPPSLSYR